MAKLKTLRRNRKDEEWKRQVEFLEEENHIDLDEYDSCLSANDSTASSSVGSRCDVEAEDMRPRDARKKAIRDAIRLL